MDAEHGVVTGVPLELRESDDGEHLTGTILQEGRAGSVRREIFSPQVAPGRPRVSRSAPST